MSEVFNEQELREVAELEAGEQGIQGVNNQFPCPKCGKLYKNRSGVITHLSSICKPQKVNCVGCGELLANPKSWRKHVLQLKCGRPEDRKSKCLVPECDHWEKDWELMREHLRTHGPEQLAKFDGMKKDVVVKGRKPINRKCAQSSTPNLQPNPVEQDHGPADESDGHGEMEQSVVARGQQADVTELINRIKLYPFLGTGDKIEVIVIEDKANFLYPGHAHLKLSEYGFFMSFPALVAFLYKTGLIQRFGAVKVTPPPISNPDKEMDRILALARTTPILQTYKNTAIPSVNNGKLFSLEVEQVQYDHDVLNVDQFLADDPLKEVDENLTDLEKQEKVFETLQSPQTPEYGANVVASLFQENVVGWNLSLLDNDLNNTQVFWDTRHIQVKDERSKKWVTREERDFVDSKGVRTPMLYVGRKYTSFCLHTEDENLGSVFKLHFGGRKVWYAVPARHSRDVQRQMAIEFPEEAAKCPSFLRHKANIIHPSAFDDWGIQYTKIVQEEGEYVILGGSVYHMGYNESANCGEATNFHCKEIWPYFKINDYPCFCQPYRFSLSRLGPMQYYENENMELFLEGKLTALIPDHEDEGPKPVLTDEMLDREYKEKHDDLVARYPDAAWLRFEERDPDEVTRKQKGKKQKANVGNRAKVPRIGLSKS